MKVARWGNSLAVRLPRSYVEALALEEGDEIDFPAEAIRKVDGERGRRALALERLERLSEPLPPGFTFRRDDIYEDHRNGFSADPAVTDER